MNDSSKAVSVFYDGKQDAQMLLYQNLLDSRCKYLANEKLDAFSFFPNYEREHEN